ncbi:MAG: hypothetical protein B6244_02860 [Candidatus Cloacimonetes bacterium 4572_55]|nr:MAG: hypothetical protein B6244_02860 [Candidatus Cloacimonetes bacterium 4572_55]
MIHATIGQMVKWCSGTVIHGEADQNPTGVSIDSRTIRPGELFVALQGTGSDGHLFVEDAMRKGACAALISSKWADDLDGKEFPSALLMSDDPLIALQEIARYYRKLFDIPCVAVTGSNGKTTSKDLIAHVFSEEKSVLSTKGNLNNHIGTPLTLLGLNPNHQMMVVEMGMNRLGEIDRLAHIAAPDMGVITNVGPVHLEFLKSVENVYQAKLELADHVERLFVNGDDPVLVQRAKERVSGAITYGFSETCDVRATDIIPTQDRLGMTFRVEGRGYRLNLPGRHNLYSALTAIAVARLFGYSPEIIAEGLIKAKITRWRSQVIRAQGYTLINDAYNANPASMANSLGMLCDFPAQGKRIVLLGDMLELGEKSVQYHRKLGAQIAKNRIDRLIAIGRYASEIETGAVENGMRPERIECEESGQAGLDRLSDRMRGLLKRGDVALIKGSRSMKLEKIVGKLIEN